MGSDPSSRHMHTEKRRRDRIASGFESLKTVVPTADKRADKATFLQQVVEYVVQLQDAVKESVRYGGLDNITEEMRWQIRLLLPRFQPQVSDPAAQAVEEHLTQTAAISFQPSEADAGRTTQANDGLTRAPMPTTACRADSLGHQHVSQQNLPQRSDLQEESCHAKRWKQTEGLGSTQEDALVTTAIQSNSKENLGQTSQSDTPVGDASRINQLQQLLLQLQAQQAATAQQLQLQQAALMQNQAINALSFNNLLQRNLRQQQALPEGMANNAPPNWQESVGQGSSLMHTGQYANMEAQAKEAQPSRQCDSAEKGPAKARRKPKLRIHTSVGQYSIRQDDVPNSVAYTGRPDRSTSSSGLQDSPRCR